MRRGPWTLKNNLYSHCDCSYCLSIDNKKPLNRGRPDVRKVKSYEPFNENSNIQELQLKPQKPIYVLYQRNLNRNRAFVNTRSVESVNLKTSGGNFYGIRQKCQDSDRSRMPWSMANSHRNPQDYNFGSSEFVEGETKQEYDNRVFPFQSTPSGNLKVGPQQVVFESKKVSVLVADPRHTKVNIKAELTKQQEIASNSAQASFSKDTKIMETEESRNAKKNQILTAMALMGNDATRGAALNQMMPPGMPPMSLPPRNPMFKPPPPPMNPLDESLYGPNEIHDERDRDDSRSVESDDSPKPELNLVKLGFTASAPIDWSQIKLPQKTNLYKHMHYRITNYINPDCLVQIEDVQFNCHLLVLQCYSVYFNEKTARDVVKLPADSVTPKAFELIYEWMTYVHGDSYTILKRDNILEVFSAAQFLGIKELEEQCWAFVDCEELFSEDTAFLLYLEAKKVGNTAVMELMIPRIMKFFLTLVSSKDFLDLKLDEVYVLLSSNYITVHSEIEVFMSAVRWLWHDWKTRKECLEQVMSCVRFGLIAPWQLVDIRRNPENPEFLEITSHPAVQQMIDNGLAYAIIKYWYGNQTGDYYHWIDLLGLTEPPTRNWAGEEKNYVTYREFLHDLEQYRKELFYEKERLRAKHSGKSKRGSEQSGLTTSPRDIIQQPQPERRSSSRKHSTSSNKNSKVDSALADSMRNEIVSDKPRI